MQFMPFRLCLRTLSASSYNVSFPSTPVYNGRLEAAPGESARGMGLTTLYFGFVPRP